jgi:lsr operon transcriptional repressor
MELEAHRNQEARPDMAALDIATSSNEDQQRIRVAWLYIVAGLTQEQIGRRLGLARARDNRLLANSRGDGTVPFHIRSKLASTIELEQLLIDRYGLARAVVGAFIHP